MWAFHSREGACTIGVDQLDVIKVYNFVSVYAATAKLHVFLVCVYNYVCMYMHIRDCKNVRMQRINLG